MILIFDGIEIFSISRHANNKISNSSCFKLLFPSKYYKRAAKKDNSEAFEKLDDIYFEGKYVDKNITKAMDYLINAGNKYI